MSWKRQRYKKTSNFTVAYDFILIFNIIYVLVYKKIYLFCHLKNINIIYYQFREGSALKYFN